MSTASPLRTFAQTRFVAWHGRGCASLPKNVHTSETKFSKLSKHWGQCIVNVQITPNIETEHLRWWASNPADKQTCHQTDPGSTGTTWSPSVSAAFPFYSFFFLCFPFLSFFIFLSSFLSSASFSESLRNLSISRWTTASSSHQSKRPPLCDLLCLLFQGQNPVDRVLRTRT